MIAVWQLGRVLEEHVMFRAEKGDRQAPGFPPGTSMLVLDRRAVACRQRGQYRAVVWKSQLSLSGRVATSERSALATDG